MTAIFLYNLNFVFIRKNTINYSTDYLDIAYLYITIIILIIANNISKIWLTSFIIVSLFNNIFLIGSLPGKLITFVLWCWFHIFLFSSLVTLKTDFRKTDSLFWITNMSLANINTLKCLVSRYLKSCLLYTSRCV